MSDPLKRSLDPGEGHGAHKSRCATRRARLRREREDRVAPLPSKVGAGGMTAGGGGNSGGNISFPNRDGRADIPATEPERGDECGLCRRGASAPPAWHD